jgi:hypothetical protein|uniref:Uncharacterized protein n=1 Tax=candidate division WOR-3 bacterium TaxID=2052148 RepID=A0A7C3YRX0_UNCW3
MIKVIGERNKIIFFSLFGFQCHHWVKGEIPPLEPEDKLFILDEEIPEIEEMIEKQKGFPLLFSLYPGREKDLLAQLWK